MPCQKHHLLLSRNQEKQNTMNTQRTHALPPFLLLAFTFFIVGFMTVVNGQCQGPLKTAFLSHAGGLKNTLATLISFFFFLGYLVNGPLAGRWTNRYGYKSILLKGLLIMVAALATYLAAAFSAEMPGEILLSPEGASIPYGFFIFLMGSFLMGTSAALLQTAIIPYVSAYDLPHTQAVQRVNITCAGNSLGTTIAPFFVTGVIFGGLPMEEIHARQLKLPLLVLMTCILLIWLCMRRMPLPDISGTRTALHEKGQRSLWSFQHLRLGVIAIFFYVGAEAAVGTNINLHTLSTDDAGQHLPALLATLYWGTMMMGRIISGLFGRVSARLQLIVASTGAALLLVVTMLANNLWILACVGLFQSVMWGCIFTLAVNGLGKYTSQASGLFMAGVFGGAVIPVLQGFLADVTGSWRWTWILIVVCELVMLHYALFGSKVKEGDAEVPATN